MPAAKDISGLSEEDRDKLRVKREKNKAAAQKCRQKKQEHIEVLEKQVSELTAINEDLRNRILELEAKMKSRGAAKK